MSGAIGKSAVEALGKEDQLNKDLSKEKMMNNPQWQAQQSKFANAGEKFSQAPDMSQAASMNSIQSLLGSMPQQQQQQQQGGQRVNQYLKSLLGG